MKNIKDEVRAIVAEKLGIELEQVIDSANFQSDLGADSLDIVELIMEFEQKFGIEISDEDAGNNIITVGDAISFIEKTVKNQSEGMVAMIENSLAELNKEISL
jgi:acyl carrier protein